MVYEYDFLTILISIIQERVKGEVFMKRKIGSLRVCLAMILTAAAIIVTLFSVAS